ncbi:hypothetical protein C8R43DRAFT_317168 [Mycena crocata]|nr:hypothetical protein C8R43DRAFT_317168 [Mycena crocata]
MAEKKDDSMAEEEDEPTTVEDEKRRKKKAEDEEKKRKRAEDDERRRRENKAKALCLLDALPGRLRTPILEDQNSKKISDPRERVIKRRLEEERYTAAVEAYSTKMAGYQKEWDKYLLRMKTYDRNAESRRKREAKKREANPSLPPVKPNPPKQPTPPVEPQELGPDTPLTAEQEAILQGAGVHSVLRVVVGWPAKTLLHVKGATLLTNIAYYFDEEHHPIVELDIGHWSRTMEILNPPWGYVEHWRGRSRVGQPSSMARPAKKKENVGIRPRWR